MNMAGMIFGPIPAFRDVVQTVIELKRRLNEPGLEPAVASTP
jgi:hypothetical protein